MRTTIDRAGRVVVPKTLRDRVGLNAGEVDIEVDGEALRLRPVAGGRVVERDGRTVIVAGAAGGLPIDDDVVDHLRRADQR